MGHCSNRSPGAWACPLRIVQLFIWPSAVVSRLLALALILGCFELAELTGGGCRE
jgi:hypothetical protein